MMRENKGVGMMTDAEKQAYTKGFKACLNMIDEEYDGTNGFHAIEKAALYFATKLQLWEHGAIEHPDDIPVQRQ
jgi:hypothetical protein